MAAAVQNGDIDDYDYDDDDDGGGDKTTIELRAEAKY